MEILTPAKVRLAPIDSLERLEIFHKAVKYTLADQDPEQSKYFQRFPAELRHLLLKKEVPARDWEKSL